MAMNRILLAAPKSGSGKTMITCGIITLLKRRGLKVAAFKCGPDYIDPMFHRQVLGVPSGNLDPYFTEPETLRYLLREKAEPADITVIEGVMGYYDGLGGVRPEASAYDVARITKTPVILVLDAKGASLSLAALVKGFKEFKEDSNIRGVILNRVSGMIYPALKEQIETECGVKVLGYVPAIADLEVPSRHLGLVAPEEVRTCRSFSETLAEAMGETLDLEEILALAEEATPAEGKSPELLALSKEAAPAEGKEPELSAQSEKAAPAAGKEPELSKEAASVEGKAPELPALSRETAPAERKEPELPALSKDAAPAAGKAPELSAEAAPVEGKAPELLALSKEAVPAEGKAPEFPVLAYRKGEEKLRIGVAFDEAFSFYYTENFELVRKMGAEPVLFSPLKDKALPEGISALVFGGGYPENFAKELSENQQMREAVKKAVETGMPCIAECGGFMYLGSELEDETGAIYPMTGILPGKGYPTHRLGRFGYIEATIQKSGLLGKQGDKIRGHEFHYWDSTENGEDFLAEKPVGTRSWPCMFHTETLAAGFPHFYFYNRPEMLYSFLEKALSFSRSGRNSEAGEP